MTSVWLFGYIFLYVSVVFAKADECITYNFENDVDSLFRNDTGICEGMLQGMSTWNVGSYSEIRIESPHPDSTSFFSASPSLSCGTTFAFSMATGGAVDVNVYVDGISATDQISVLAMQVVTDGNDASVGTAAISASGSDFVSGWQKLRIDVVGSGSFVGYLSIIGMGSANSVVLIDSFKYIPPNVDQESCAIYGESEDSTAQPTTETTRETTTDIATETTTETYTVTTANPTIETTTETIAESTTETYTVSTASPTIETTIETTANPTIATTTETIAESTTETYTVSTANPTIETSTEKIAESTTETYTVSTANPTIETTIETTANPTIATTTETIAESTTETYTVSTANPTIETTIETTANPTIETTTETQDITTQQIDDIEECVTYDFESDFDVRFSTDNYLCDGFLSWQLENYTYIDMESPKPSSTVFMTPHEVTSCISSFVFKMEPEGIVEASVFMDPVQSLDHIIIIAQRLTGNEFDTVAGFIKYHPENPVFITGWNVIRFSLLDLTSFDGYLIFIGAADKSSTVLVDSVRYIPPQTPTEHASCNVY